jgi:metal-dependent amidase/aminoacylase/carboxypeptidase family protein
MLNNVDINTSLEQIDGLEAIIPEMVEFRHKIHEHPETAFEEINTAKCIAEKLKEYGLEVYQNIAKTGVIGILKEVPALVLLFEQIWMHCILASRIHFLMPRK